jgi:sugar phosphate isomerase/epimerase
MMRFGVCAGSDRAAAIATAGYDYIELGAGGELVPDQDEAAWREKRRILDSLPLPCETFNLFVRGFKVTGPEADPVVQERYVHTALARAAQVGGKFIVFGSGGARRVPDNYSREQAEAEILRFLGFCADAYEKTGVVVVVEPLNHKECNIINSVSEGADYVRRIHRPGVRNLADSYHMEGDNEPLDAIIKDADVLAHAHTADTGRVAPGQGGYDHVALFRAFRAAGYDARLSLECKWNDFDAEIGPALAHLKQAYTTAQTD